MRGVVLSGPADVSQDEPGRDPYAEGVYLFAGVELWVNYALLLLMMALRLWAVIDCATRKSSAFPAVNKLTKPVWLAITIGGAVLSALLYGYGPLNLISLITLVASLVYLADVRPAVREVSGGSGQRW